ncbi:MAG: helix-turn-helix transcriptional regulator [Brachyspira sp.]|nr:helix-turn-helix transcriptional regulator [Brachyspira sp.]
MNLISEDENMKSKDKPIIQEKSSEKVANFLEKNGLHKKDFAEMIGVTLSYVYNLIDNTIPFSTRSTTLERIATVMEIEPEDFEEYKIPQEPRVIDDFVEYLQTEMKHKNMSVVNFLKAFPRKKRLEIVDILRGNLPIPIDYKELTMIAQVLELNKDDVYSMWERRMKSVLETNGMNIYANAALVNAMFDCAKKYISLR